MSSREQSPEIVIHGDQPSYIPSAPDNSQRPSKAAAKSLESSTARPELSSAIRHIDTENAAPEACDVSTSNGKAGRAFSLSASMKSEGQQQPMPTVSQLRASASLNRLSATSGTAVTTPSETRTSTATTNTASATQARLSGTAGRPPAVPPLPIPQMLQPQPRQPASAAARAPAKTPSASMPRAAASTNGARRTGGGSRSFLPKVSTPAPNYVAYQPDVVKYLKEVVRRRDEAAKLKLLPSAQLLEQAVLQEQVAHEQIFQQQASAFMQLTHKKKEAEAKIKEQQTTKAYKTKLEEQKQQHKEEMGQQKASVTEGMKEMEAEIKERLQLIVTLQPRLGIVQAVMAQIQDPASDCSLLADLMQEDKQLQKALKGDARYNKSKTADVDGGAAPYWWKQCVCASFNVAAIVKHEPYRASIVDVNVATKVAADKKVVAVKDVDGSVVAWAHTRTGPDLQSLVEAYLEAKPTVAELPAAAYLGVMWPKDDAVEVLKAAKASKSPTAAIVPEVITIFSYKEVGSAELQKKDVKAAGEAAS